jgi:hypothetical protein
VALPNSGCEKFCQCAHASTQPNGSVTYYWVVQSCPPGTLFDESLPTPVCNHANQVSCDAGGTVGVNVSSGGVTGNSTGRYYILLAYERESNVTYYKKNMADHKF